MYRIFVGVQISERIHKKKYLTKISVQVLTPWILRASNVVNILMIMWVILRLPKEN